MVEAYPQNYAGNRAEQSIGSRSISGYYGAIVLVAEQSIGSRAEQSIGSRSISGYYGP